MRVVRDGSRRDHHAAGVASYIAGHPVQQPRRFRKGPAQIGLRAQPERLSGVPDFVRAHAQREGRFAHAAAHRKGAVVGHHRRAAAEVGEHGGQQGGPLVPGEVDVDVRRVRPPLVQEAFEKQVLRQRFHVGEPQEVRHDAGRRAAAAAGAGAAQHDVAHHQEI